MKFAPTTEQTAIIDAYRIGENLRVEAGAGTGKTSTLVECATSRPDAKTLYLAYNKAIAVEAGGKFGDNVNARTTHSIAFGAARGHLKAGRRLCGARIRAMDGARILGIYGPATIGKDRAPLGPQQLYRLAIATVGRFCKTASLQLEAWHVPNVNGLEDVHDELAAAVLPYAVRAWDDLRSPRGRLRFEHDHYLKMFQISVCGKGTQLPYDVILVDEAQDLNPCVKAIVGAQRSAQLVHVGDSCQAINGWNGAVNAMASAPGRMLTLSQSFRFGTTVAEEGNVWLDLLGPKAPIRVRGLEAIQSTIAPLGVPDAVLCRTNAGVMGQAIAHLDAGRRTAIVGGGEELARLADASIELDRYRRTSHPELAAFTSWREVVDYAENDTTGSDLATNVRLIASLTPERIIAAVAKLTTPDRAQVTCLTAHKSKGLEWPTVKIGLDFVEPKPNEQTGKVTIPDALKMLAYVAVTRAQRVLDVENLAWGRGHLTTTVGAEN